ncbi:hypothetical protein [Ramlibacter alkalitolerans]|jgi:hypothetical protein|uniref:Uncharacterized protein n=1 Tax=Ramlibacter alkalitolerans TaxID=2039631 RepID=A0ABS1JS90_9BURK|nr:hypothetical protein [Ramlibacter alkalitolerans]MBL0427103.1 hypothetical protein [Ramlibacter alkalitolerans]
MQLTQHDLIYDDYSWADLRRDDPKRTGRPDHVLFNRRDGREMVAFLACNFPDAEDAQRAEWAIRHHVPGRLHSRKEVRDWLKLNWAFIRNVCQAR